MEFFERTGKMAISSRLRVLTETLTEQGRNLSNELIAQLRDVERAVEQMNAITTSGQQNTVS